MDFIKFVNSKDIRKYLYDIDYKLSGEQKLILVENCYRIPLKEKFEAYEEILKEPDENLIIRHPAYFKNEKLKRGDLENESLYELTEKILKKYKILLEMFFCKEKNCSYEVKILEGGCLEAFNFTTARFSSLDNAIQWSQNDITSRSDCRKPVDVVQISKKYLFDKPTDSIYRGADKKIVAFFDSNLNIIDLTDGIGIFLSEELIGAETNKLLVYLPMPFKPGDILEVQESGIRKIIETHSRFEPYERGMPFVFISSTPDESLSEGEYLADIQFKGFYFDKKRQYILNCNGYNHMYDLEYYRKPLEGKERFLKILSMKLKDKASVPDEAVRMAYEYCRTLAIQQDLEDSNECFNFDIKSALSDEKANLE